MKSIKIIFGLVLFFYSVNFSFAETGAKYLIFAPDNYVATLQPLADWKTKKGVKAKIVPLSESGNTASQIKNYIVNAYNTWQIRPEYILLAGYTNVLPASGSSDDYYADMTGNYRIELSIGRLPASTITECELLVAKVLGYERDPYLGDVTWFKKGTTIIREDNPPDAYYQNDCRYMRNLMLANGFVHTDSFISTAGHNSTHVNNAISDGRSLVVYRGQAVTNWWAPFNAVDPASMTNGFKLPVVISATCVTLSLSYTGYYADRFMLAGTAQNPKGAVAFFGTTGIGTSVYRSNVSRGFFRSLFEERTFVLGDITKRAKLIMDSLYPSQSRYQEWNLYGDPELNLWTDTPKRLTATFNSLIYTIPQIFNVQVHEDSIAVAGAKVCLMMDTLVYEIGYTNASGIASFYIAPPSAGVMSVTVTGQNLKPYEDFVSVAHSSLNYDIGILDIIAPQGTIPVGTNIMPQVKVKNFGANTDTFSTTVIIGSVYNQTDPFQFLSSGDSNIIPLPNWIATAGTHQVTAFIASNNDQYHGNDTMRTVIDVVSPNDAGVDAILEPDSTCAINQALIPKARIKNYGTNTQTNFTATCSIIGLNNSVRYTNTQNISMLTPGNTVIVNFDYWTPDIAEQCSIKIRTNLIGDDNPSNDAKSKVTNVIMLMINEGFNDPSFPPSGWQAQIVNGSYNWQWTSSGTQPSCTPFEGTGMATFQSWFASSGSSARLITPMIPVNGAARCSLKFMMMHDQGYASYNDQVQVQISTNGTNFTTVETFNRYSGSNGWTEHAVYLGEFTTSFYVAFYAVSAYGNNMYLDCVRLFSPTAITENETSILPSLAVTNLNAPKPNPTRNSFVNLSFSLAKPSQVSMKVYDASGKLIKSLVNESKSSGMYSITWNCRDEHNHRVAEGVYFCTLETDNHSSTKKLVLTR
ncbi:MAG: T9SS type A sorting domain-containing protein [Candidatus Latescibacteria bacterium]|nr:T9SS type A sorting domain-containing protein [Candidatus Latescibacterota bacterium]